MPLSTLPILYILTNLLQITSSSILPRGFRETLIADGLDGSSLFIDNSNIVWVVQKYGVVNRIVNDVLQTRPVLDLSQKVDNDNQRGLLDIAVDPNFSSNGYIYVFYTVLSQNRNRVSRFQVINGSAPLSSEYILLNLDPLQFNINNGGSLLLKNPHLYISTGDGGEPGKSSSYQSLHGKILRIFLNGAIPPGNPFYRNLKGDYRAIYALGLRNPLTLTLNQKSDSIFINDEGFASWEEINKLIAGSHYGWPLVEGKLTIDKKGPMRYLDPEFVYSQAGNYCAITGGAFYNSKNKNFPSELNEAYFIGDYCAGTIRALDLQKKTFSSNFIITGLNRPISIVFSSNSELYYLDLGPTNGQKSRSQSCCGRVVKVVYSGSSAPSFSFQPQNLSVVEGGSVSFTFGAQGDAPLSIQWLFDGKEVKGAIQEVYTRSNAKISDDGKKIVVVVSNKAGKVTSAPAYLKVVKNETVSVVITSPVNNFKTQSGSTLSFSGYGANKAGRINRQFYTWEIVLHQGDNQITVLQPISGISNGSFYINPSRDLNIDDWFEVKLRVQDGFGLVSTGSVSVYLKTAYLEIVSNPSSMVLDIKGSKHITPVKLVCVMGARLSLSTSNQTYEGVVYTFAKWSDSLEPTRFIILTKNKTISIEFKKSESIKKGIKYDFYEGTFADFPDLTDLNSSKTGVITSLGVPSTQDSSFAVLYTTYINVSQEGKYKFQVKTPNYFKLILTTQEVLAATNILSSSENETNSTYTASLPLSEGAQQVKLVYLKNETGESGIDLQYAEENQNLTPISGLSVYADNPSPCSYQFITFDMIDNINYTLQDSYEIRAMSSSFLPVEFSISGPAYFGEDGSTSYVGNSVWVNLRGYKGTISVTAKQTGNLIYCPALSVSKSTIIVMGYEKPRDPLNPGNNTNSTNTIEIVGNSDKNLFLVAGVSFSVCVVLIAICVLVKIKIVNARRRSLAAQAASPQVNLLQNNDLRDSAAPQAQVQSNEQRDQSIVVVRILTQEHLPPEEMPNLDNVLAGLDLSGDKSDASELPEIIKLSLDNSLSSSFIAPVDLPKLGD